MTGSTAEPVAEYVGAESTACAAALEPGAGCDQESSETGLAGDLPPAGDASTASAAPAAAELETERPKPPQTLRELERALRGLGYSQRQAAAIARKGFRPATAEPEHDRAALLVELRDALRRSIANLKAPEP